MSKKEREREVYCLMANCRYYRRCKVKWGKDCARQGGGKIPRFKNAPKPWEYNYLIITGAMGEEIRVRRPHARDVYFG